MKEKYYAYYALFFMHNLIHLSIESFAVEVILGERMARYLILL